VLAGAPSVARGRKGKNDIETALKKRGKGQSHMTRAAKAMFRAFTALSLQRS
jgi:hypothetical protein